MSGSRIAILGVLFSIFLAACGQEIYSTPQKTLQRYVQYRQMGTLAETENCLDTFTEATRAWWAAHRLDACYAKFGQSNSLCGENKVDISNQWGAFVEPYGPKTDNVDSANIDDKAGTADLVVEGKTIHFVKEKHNWKIDGLFGAEDDMKAIIAQRNGSQ